ncbi:MAG TPA: alpha/beta hydrolase [Verrucomicrobiae bacterium]|nr:alpha/beta hydrolase [Verrucomicrobiae bacterium]
MIHTFEAAGEQVRIPFARFELAGTLNIPEGSTGVVLFAHGSGSSRHSPRNHFVAGVLRGRGLGTLLFDLLTAREEQKDSYTAHFRFDIELLSERLLGAARWLLSRHGSLRIGYFGSSTGAAAALTAAAQPDPPVAAIVSRGGRPDLAGRALALVTAPTLLIVGGEDTVVIEMNREAYRQLQCPKQLKLIPGATHLFEEAGALEQAANLAADWFGHYLLSPAA